MHEVIIDVGSKTIRVANPKTGVIIAEPTSAVIKYERKSMSLIAYGNEVQNKLGQLEPDEQIVYPIKEGAIGHKRAAVLLFSALLSDIIPVHVFLKPKIKVTAIISAGLDNSEKRELEDVFIEAGASMVVMLESPPAAVALSNNKNVALVDIGGTKCEIAVLSEGHIAVGVTVALAGDAINQAIIDYIADKYRVVLEKFTVEKLKKSLASLFLGDISTATVGGKGLVGGAPKSLEIKASELREAILPIFEQLTETINSVLNQTPEKIAEDIYAAGIMLVGGTAFLSGIAEFIAKKTFMAVEVVKSPENANINGGIKLATNKTELSKILNLQRV